MLYIIALECSHGILLAQENIEGKKNVLHYLSLTLVGPEIRYSLLRRCVWRSYLPSQVLALPLTLSSQVDLKGESLQVYSQPTHSQEVINKVDGSAPIVRHREHHAENNKRTNPCQFPHGASYSG